MQKKQEHMTDLIEVSESTSDDPVLMGKTGCNDDPANVQKRSEWLYQPSGSKE